MIKIHIAPSPNAHKTLIALEEIGAPYEIVEVDVANGEQHSADFLRLNPNSKIPVLEDGSRIVWESGAILFYLAEKHDPEGRLLSRSEDRRWEAIQYAFFQAAGLGPNLGRLSSQLQRPEADRNAEMVEIFATEVDRLIGVLDLILSDGRPHLAGEYSVADIMHYPWLRPVLALGAPQLTQRTRVVDWVRRIEHRPAVERAYANA